MDKQNVSRNGGQTPEQDPQTRESSSGTRCNNQQTARHNSTTPRREISTRRCSRTESGARTDTRVQALGNENDTQRSGCVFRQEQTTPSTQRIERDSERMHKSHALRREKVRRTLEENSPTSGSVTEAPNTAPHTENTPKSARSRNSLSLYDISSRRRILSSSSPSSKASQHNQSQTKSRDLSMRHQRQSERSSTAQAPQSVAVDQSNPGMHTVQKHPKTCPPNHLETVSHPHRLSQRRLSHDSQLRSEHHQHNLNGNQHRFKVSKRHSLSEKQSGADKDPASQQSHNAAMYSYRENTARWRDNKQNGRSRDLNPKAYNRSRGKRQRTISSFDHDSGGEIPSNQDFVRNENKNPASSTSQGSEKFRSSFVDNSLGNRFELQGHNSYQNNLRGHRRELCRVGINSTYPQLSNPRAKQQDHHWSKKEYDCVLKGHKNGFHSCQRNTRENHRDERNYSRKIPTSDKQFPHKQSERLLSKDNTRSPNVSLPRSHNDQISMRGNNQRWQDVMHNKNKFREQRSRENIRHDEASAKVHSSSSRRVRESTTQKQYSFTRRNGHFYHNSSSPQSSPRPSDRPYHHSNMRCRFPQDQMLSAGLDTELSRLAAHNPSFPPLVGPSQSGFNWSLLHPRWHTNSFYGAAHAVWGILFFQPLQSNIMSSRTSAFPVVNYNAIHRNGTWPLQDLSSSMEPVWSDLNHRGNNHTQQDFTTETSAQACTHSVNTVDPEILQEDPIMNDDIERDPLPTENLFRNQATVLDNVLNNLARQPYDVETFLNVRQQVFENQFFTINTSPMDFFVRRGIFLDFFWQPYLTFGSLNKRFNSLFDEMCFGRTTYIEDLFSTISSFFDIFYRPLCPTIDKVVRKVFNYLEDCSNKVSFGTATDGSYTLQTTNSELIQPELPKSSVIMCASSPREVPVESSRPTEVSPSTEDLSARLTRLESSLYEDLVGPPEAFGDEPSNTQEEILSDDVFVSENDKQCHQSVEDAGSCHSVNHSPLAANIMPSDLQDVPLNSTITSSPNSREQFAHRFWTQGICDNSIFRNEWGLTFMEESSLEPELVLEERARQSSGDATCHSQREDAFTPTEPKTFTEITTASNDIPIGNFRNLHLLEALENTNPYDAVPTRTSLSPLITVTFEKETNSIENISEEASSRAYSAFFGYDNKIACEESSENFAEPALLNQSNNSEREASSTRSELTTAASPVPDRLSRDSSLLQVHRICRHDKQDGNKTI